ncbi:glycine rich protein [Neobacillus bataviensis]|uniref:Glycine rich protein n=1 Tax=Neobacillus bataviensis TaxID=220685 RepID=A0A561CG82_9BACI|nr:glycine rich protein [Neobacillus bataviensis]
MLKKLSSKIGLGLLILMISCVPTLSKAEASVNNTTEFQYTGGIDTWTVPQTGTYRLETWGAQGGGQVGGNGAHIAGDFQLNKGELINLIVGGRGGLTTQGTNYSGGGGGGTFIYKNAFDAYPLIVAGGGGGQAENAYGGAGSATMSPTNSILGTGNGLGGDIGYGGKGGIDLYDYSTGGGGAGWLSDGQNGILLRNPEGQGGKSPRNGGSGGISSHPSFTGFYGGFGGGGSNSDNTGAGGGGGGYTGGGGGNNYTYINNLPTWGAGGGGGSYNSGTNQLNEAGINGGDGLVRITYLGQTPTLTGVTINQRTIALPLGNTYQIVVTAKYSDGSTKDVTNSATYKSSNGSIATINSAGVIYGNSIGNTDMSITYKERTSSGSTLILSSRVKVTVN